MSFTAEVKDELARVELGCKGCVKAQLAALIRIEGSLGISGGRPRLEITTETASVARTIIALLHDGSFGLKTELTIRRSVLHKAHNFLIVVPYQAGLSQALKDLGILGDEGFEQGIRYGLVAKDCCAASYLRGAFLASGYVADPRGDFHFELSTTSLGMAEGLIKLMARIGVKARCVQRHNTHVVYLKGPSSSRSIACSRACATTPTAASTQRSPTPARPAARQRSRLPPYASWCRSAASRPSPSRCRRSACCA